MPGIVLKIADYVDTDLDSFEAFDLARSFFDGDITVFSGTGPSAGDNVEELDGIWLCYADPEGWQRVMEVVDAGGDPSTVSYEGDIASIAGTVEQIVIGEDESSEPAAVKSE